MNELTERHITFNAIPSALAGMRHERLEQILSDGEAMHKGIDPAFRTGFHEQNY